MSSSETDTGLASQQLATALLAPYFAGWSCQLLFSGIAYSCCWRYLSSSRYAKDGWRTRVFIWIVMAINTTSVVFAAKQTSYWGCTQARTLEDLFAESPIDCYAPMPVVMISTIVQGFYARRAAALFQRQRDRILFLGGIAAVMLIEILGAIATMVALVTYLQGSSDFIAPLTYQQVSSIWMWSTVSIDATIAICLINLLRKRVEGFNVRTDSVVKQLMRLAIASSAYTAFLSLLAAILSIALNQNNDLVTDVPTAFWLPLPALYTISLFSTLSTQDRLAQDIANYEGPPGAVPTFRVSAPSFMKGTRYPARDWKTEVHRPAFSNLETASIQVSVEVEVELDSLSQTDLEEEKRKKAPLYPRRGDFLSPV